MVGKSLLMFVCCIIVDIVRIYLFKFVGFNKLMKKLQVKIDDFYKNYMADSDI